MLYFNGSDFQLWFLLSNASGYYSEKPHLTYVTNRTGGQNVSDPSRYQLEYSLNYAIGLATLCFIGGIENVLILTTIWRSKLLRSAYYGFIANLASSQLTFCLVIGITFGWLRIVFFLRNVSSTTTMMACTAGMIPYHGAQVCALLTRFTIAIDRFLAFSFPIEYRNRSTWYAPGMALACWLWPLVEALTYFGINYSSYRYRPMPMCSGSGWKEGTFLKYTAYRDLTVGGLTAFTYVVTAALVAKKFLLLRYKGGQRFEFQSKPYQFRLLIASGTDAMIFTACNLMAYIVRSFIMMHLDGTHRLAANFSVGLLLAFTNVTDFILYMSINRDFRGEFLNMCRSKRTDRANSLSNHSATNIVHTVCGSPLPTLTPKKSLCIRLVHT